MPFREKRSEPSNSRIFLLAKSGILRRKRGEVHAKSSLILEGLIVIAAVLLVVIIVLLVISRLHHG